MTPSPGLHRHRGLGQVAAPAAGPAHRELPLTGPHRRAPRDAAGRHGAAGRGLRLRGGLLGSLRGGEDWQQELAEFEEVEDLEPQVGKVGFFAQCGTHLPTETRTQTYTVHRYIYIYKIRQEKTRLYRLD